MPSSAPDFPILLMDGGLGTTLEESHGVVYSLETPLGCGHPLVSDPDILVAAQRSFVDAGADILLSATYQTSFEGFARTPRVKGEENERNGGRGENGEEEGKREIGYDEEEAEEYMRSAISHARQAISSSSIRREENGKRKETKVGLSLGAYGATLSPSQEYAGKYDENHNNKESLRDWHKRRLEVFQNHPDTWYNVDYIAFETIPRIDEVSAVREAVFKSEGGWDRRFWISCVFPNLPEKIENGEERYFLSDGSSVGQVVEAMLGGTPADGMAVPFGIGINCTKTKKIRVLVEEFEEEVERLLGEGKGGFGWPWLVIYPDGAEGLVYNTATKNWDVDEEEAGLKKKSWDETMIEIVKEIKERRKWKGLIVGGCCKVLPCDIAKLRQRIDELE